MAFPDVRVTLGQALGLHREIQKILHHRVAVLCEDAFGVELHAPDGEFLVPQPHDFAFLRFRSDLQAIRQCLAFDDERVVTRGDVGGGDAFE